LSRPVAICGLGGIGKTQTVVQYTYLYSHEYKFVFWVTADSEGSIISGYVNVAKLLDLPLKNDSDQKLIVSAVLNWFKNNENWLLVFDNADDPSVLRNLMPLNSKGHILFTSRAPLFEELGATSQIEMDKMLPDEARKFFIKRTGRKNLKPSELKALDELTSELDYLPLAMEQAGAYIRKIECSFEDYLSSYKISGLKLLERSRISTDKYPKSVATTWILNFENIKKDSKVSAEILFVSAFLNPSKIPVDIFIKGAKELGPLISSALENIESLPVILYESFEPIRQYSLITRDVNNYTYDIHRLVQAVLRDGMDETTQRIWVERTVKALNCAFPEIEYNNWDLCDKLLPHIQTCEKYIKKWNMETKEFAKLLNSTGNYLYERARFKECELYFNSSFDIRKKILDSTHPDIAESMTDLAALYVFQGRYSEAEPLIKRALEIREIVLGPEHPDTAASLNILAGTYNSQGRYSEAEPFFKRALEIREKALGSEHPDTAISLDNLAGIYRSQGRYPEAEKLLKRALEINEKIFGSEHPNTALSLDNLSVLYQSLGKYSEAESFSKHALDIYEICSGPEHPDTSISLCNLAMCYTSQGKYPEAELLLKRAQEIDEIVLGSEHPGTATTLNNLATLYQSQGKYSEAEPLFKRVLKIREKVLGSEHPDTALSLNNLAGTYKFQGRYSEAEPLLKRAQEIDENVLGSEHPSTATTLNNLATLYQSQGKYSEAESLLKRALEIQEKIFGSENISVVSSLNNLATTYATQGKNLKAKELFLRSIDIMEKIKREDHPDFLALLENYACLLIKMKKGREASKILKRITYINAKNKN